MMKAIETAANFDENGQLIIHHLPELRNQKVKLLILIEDDETEDEFYNLSLQGLSNTYANEEPEYDLSLVKEHNPMYKNAGR
ncbi:MAG: glycosyl hydrolase family 31 [Bacteroidota bacterium]|nr:glycosyl hydrolase family 31 [Bacteroidota bacterium]